MDIIKRLIPNERKQQEIRLFEMLDNRSWPVEERGVLILEDSTIDRFEWFVVHRRAFRLDLHRPIGIRGGLVFSLCEDKAGNGYLTASNERYEYRRPLPQSPGGRGEYSPWAVDERGWQIVRDSDKAVFRVVDHLTDIEPVDRPERHAPQTVAEFPEEFGNESRMSYWGQHWARRNPETGLAECFLHGVRAHVFTSYAFPLSSPFTVWHDWDTDDFLLVTRVNEQAVCLGKEKSHKVYKEPGLRIRIPEEFRLKSPREFQTYQYQRASVAVIEHARGLMNASMAKFGHLNQGISEPRVCCPPSKRWTIGVFREKNSAMSTMDDELVEHEARSSRRSSCEYSLGYGADGEIVRSVLIGSTELLELETRDQANRRIKSEGQFERVNPVCPLAFGRFILTNSAIYDTATKECTPAPGSRFYQILLCDRTKVYYLLTFRSDLACAKFGKTRQSQMAHAWTSAHPLEQAPIPFVVRKTLEDVRQHAVIGPYAASLIEQLRNSASGWVIDIEKIGDSMVVTKKETPKFHNPAAYFHLDSRVIIML